MVCGVWRTRGSHDIPIGRRCCGDDSPAVFLSPKPLPDARTVTALPVHANLTPSPSARSPIPSLRRSCCACRVAGLALPFAEAATKPPKVRTLAAVSCIACAPLGEVLRVHQHGVLLHEHQLQSGRAGAAGGPQRHFCTRYPAGRDARAGGHWCVEQHVDIEGGSMPRLMYDPCGGVGLRGDIDAPRGVSYLVWLTPARQAIPFFREQGGVNPRAVGHG